MAVSLLFTIPAGDESSVKREEWVELETFLPRDGLFFRGTKRESRDRGRQVEEIGKESSK